MICKVVLTNNLMWFNRVVMVAWKWNNLTIKY